MRPLRNGQVRLTCAAALRHTGVSGCGIVGAVVAAIGCGGLLLLLGDAAENAHAVPVSPALLGGVRFAFWLAIAAIPLLFVYGFTREEEFIAGPDCFAVRQRWLFLSSTRTVAPSGVLRIVTDRHRSPGAAPDWWSRTLHVTSTDGSISDTQITVAQASHPIEATAESVEAVAFGDDTCVQIAAILAQITGWKVIDRALQPSR